MAIRRSEIRVRILQIAMSRRGLPKVRAEEACQGRLAMEPEEARLLVVLICCFRLLQGMNRSESTMTSREKSEPLLQIACTGQGSGRYPSA